MASTIGDVRASVRFQIRDRDSEEYLIAEDEINGMILRKSQEMTGEAIPGEAWILNALTLSAGASDTTFSASYQYDAIQMLRETSMGVLIDRLARADVEALRQGVPGSGGYPQCYYLLESTASVVTARFYPIADVAYAFDALLSRLPGDLVADATVIPYSDLMVGVIEKAVAIECVAKLPADKLAGRGLSKDVVAVWESDIQRLLKAERNRESKLRRNPFLSPAVR